jgi:hypothetical protein
MTRRGSSRVASQGIGHTGASLPSGGRGDPDPSHETDRRAERPVGLVVASEVGRVPRKQQRCRNPDNSSKDASRRDPMPLWLFAGRAEMINDPDHEAGHDKKKRRADEIHGFAVPPHARKTMQSSLKSPDSHAVAFEDFLATFAQLRPIPLQTLLDRKVIAQLLPAKPLRIS